MRTLREQMQYHERVVLISAGKEAGWLLGRMALLLGVSSTTVSRKLKEHDINWRSERARHVGDQSKPLFGEQLGIAEVYGEIKID
jgi:hypothetical protein